jgi:hypothetical protein
VKVIDSAFARAMRAQINAIKEMLLNLILLFGDVIGHSDVRPGLNSRLWQNLLRNSVTP